MVQAAFMLAGLDSLGVIRNACLARIDAVRSERLEAARHQMRKELEQAALAADEYRFNDAVQLYERLAARVGNAELKQEIETKQALARVNREVKTTIIAMINRLGELDLASIGPNRGSIRNLTHEGFTV